jgi:hypothetical protein
VTEIKVTFVDRDCQEAPLADSPRVAAWSADGVLHIELRAVRHQGQDAQGQEIGIELPVARLALTAQTAAALQVTLVHHLSELEKIGVLKRVVVPPAQEAPNKQH